MAKCQKPKELYSADQMMWNVASSLVRDFQSNLDDPSFCDDHGGMLAVRDIAGVRELSSASIEQGDTARYKALYQMRSLFKRYRFQTDTYSDDELMEKAIASFRETQNRICSLDFTRLNAKTQVVVEKAQIYIAKLLGKYSDEEHRNLCRFGRRASVGIPARMACEAARWELPISGSSEQIAWFDSEMSQVECVQNYWDAQKESDPSRSTYQVTSSLALTLVPKTFKSFRAIMPNTTIGSYMSFGLGEMLRKRLKRAGYDISVLQMKHRVLARLASEHSLFVTADLSSASDSISVQLVELLFPPDWVDILTRSRIAAVTLPDQSVVQSETFCTMGVGYTFPLQTLVFLALLKAIEATLYNRWNRRTVSVYGDDLIYSSPMHSTVTEVFEELGFVINIDKTFHEGHFRESCGGDYYRGVDVRPFQPQNGSAFVGRKTYEAMLYKYVNGLLARWDEHEIGRTLGYLVDQILVVAGTVKRVPCDFPDDSGVKCPTLQHWTFLQCALTAQPKQLGSGLCRFPFLRLVSDEREEVRHVPFLWAALRDNGYHSDYYSSDGSYCRGSSPQLYRSMVDEAIGVTERESLLITREVKPIMTIRSKISGRRLRRTVTMVGIAHTGRYTRQSGISSFEDRR